MQLLHIFTTLAFIIGVDANSLTFEGGVRITFFTGHSKLTWTKGYTMQHDGSEMACGATPCPIICEYSQVRGERPYSEACIEMCNRDPLVNLNGAKGFVIRVNRL